jgi:hypothetical protein
MPKAYCIDGVLVRSLSGWRYVRERGRLRVLWRPLWAQLIVRRRGHA